MNKIEIILGDITKISVDAIVNAANNSLLGGSGVDGAIHRVGGKQILEDCQKIRARQGKCNVGDAVITRAGKLPAKYVIHTVGPHWNGGDYNEPALLKKCYVNSFELANKFNVKTISFPNISTGIYQYPKVNAATIALDEIMHELSIYSLIEKVIIVCYEKDNYDIYKSIVNGL
ncbi:TPA: O-acetyl-ADP-ribose deacetylase [Salmonella enterica]|uniref:O-acetyl-ADP-ribose deacetylase n=1 Tax=Salmonella enterica TaxID=28901 RepID=A0A743PGG7_SALER|nr:O-acetyl-ADP-ribose deacetylase [Salmonella enterica]